MDKLDKDIVKFYNKVHQFKDDLRSNDFERYYPRSLSEISRKNKVSRMAVHKRIVKLTAKEALVKEELRKLKSKPYYYAKGTN